MQVFSTHRQIWNKLKQHILTLTNFISDRLDIDSIHWDGIEEKFFTFWNSADNCKLYAKYRSMFTSRKRGGEKKFIHTMSSAQWTISVDLMVTGLIVGTWKSPIEAINHMSDYWEFADRNIFHQLGATEEHLKLFIEEEIGNQRRINEQLSLAGVPGIPLIISPAKIKSRIAYHHARGELEMSLTPKDIISVMSRLGWRLTSKGWVEKK